MQPKNDGKVQLNVRLEEGALKAISAAASEEGEKIADYVRIAVLTATCHTRRKAAPTASTSIPEKGSRSCERGRSG